MRLRSGWRGIESLLAYPRATRAVFTGLIAIPPLALFLTSGTLEFAAVVAVAAGLGVGALVTYDRLLKGGNSRGYEVLDQEHEWDLVRPDGSLAIHRKHLRVRYLNQAISVVDFAWGEGNLFEEYSCDPGRVVDRFVARGQLWVLISLGGLRQRGEEEDLTFRRAIGDGFLNPVEWVELGPLEGRRVSLKVVFPKERPPEQVEIVRTRRSLLGRQTEHREALPTSALEEVSQRRVVSIKTGSYSPDAALKVKWTWPAIGVFVSHSKDHAQLAERLISQMEDRGLTVHTTAEVWGGRGVAPSTAGAAATVLIVGRESPDDQIRSEWSAALEEAWSPEPRPVAVLLDVGADMPAPLRALPGFRLPSDSEDWPVAFERLRNAIWSPATLLEEADVKPDRERDRQPVQKALDQSLSEAEAPPVALEGELRQRRESLERELASAESLGDEDAIRQIAYALGLVLSRLGEPAIASGLLERAIELTEKEFGSSHPAVADGTYNLALANASMGDTKIAVSQLRRAIELGESALGPDHPKVRVYRSALAQIEGTPAQDST
jgi:hypothetical protein